MEGNMTKYNLILGAELRRLRCDADLSQGDLETLSGIPKERLSRYENGHITPSLGTLIALGHGLETRPSDILRGIDL